MVESSTLIAGMPRRIWCPQAFVLFTVLVPVPTGTTSATAAAPIVVVDGGVDDALYVGPFYSEMPNTTTEILGVLHRCVVNHHFVRTLSRKWYGRRASTHTLLNDLPEAAFHVPYVVPVSVKKDQQLASVTALRVASHVVSAWRFTSFALMGGGTLEAATYKRLYMATSLILL